MRMAKFGEVVFPMGAVSSRGLDCGRIAHGLRVAKDSWKFALVKESFAMEQQPPTFTASTYLFYYRLFYVIFW
jgi:hypothetical protein